MLNRVSSFKKHCCFRRFICNKLHRIRNCELFNNIRVYVFKQVNKKRKTKINNVKYNKKSKKHLDYTANIKTNIKNINLNKNYVEKIVALLKNTVSKISKFKQIADFNAFLYIIN